MTDLPDVVSQDVEAAFRRAMRRFAATVSVITTRHSGRRYAMTATAVTSLSMAPPSLLACVYGTSRFHRVLAAEESFCVNILHQDQAAISQACARSRFPDEENRFNWIDDEDFGYLSDTQAVVLCSKAREIPFGSHTIFIGTVTRAIVRDEVAPLVFQDGQYGRCFPFPSDASIPT